ncbi:MAG TPA: TlpA disulfide reductase family protein [Blastocatellia bacterium]|nr:TlpA disulfide reductase family protein [Blastocatellia bacterium]
MKLLLAIMAIVVLFVSTLSAQSSHVTSAAGSASSKDELKPLPEIKLQDFEGKAVTADALKGNVLVLDFWATWCGPCIAEIPSLNKLQEKYGDKGVKVIGVTMASGDVADVKPFVARNKMKYTILLGDDDQAYDFNVFAFPTTFLVTKDLKIYKRYIGTGPSKVAQIEADIQKLLKD